MEPGAQIGHYEIVSFLGRGGMGEVWRARDTKLHRDVAIKSLPANFARDADRLARFGREARVLASLSHPGIGAIFGLEEDGGTHFLVLELVEGETLEDRLRRGPLREDVAVRFALAIAEAVEAAHGKGVVHRDLKPANIKITPDGRVKVLDFGLARTVLPGSDADLSQSPTMSVSGTMAGTLLGTAAYMAPEQARGETVDARADVWAFGCILFEMLSGKPAYGGGSLTEVLANVLRDPPDWTALPSATDRELRRLLERCLDKEPARRKQSIGDARVDLDRLGEAEDATFPRAGVGRVVWVALAASALAGAVFAWVGLRAFLPESGARMLRYAITLPAGDTLLGDNPFSVVDVSPDGETVVYVGVHDGLWQLYRKTRGMVEPEVIPGTEGARQPFFSPDGADVAFVADGELKRVAIGGGTPSRIAPAPVFWEGTWTEDDQIVFGGAGGLMRVAAGGGVPTPLTRTAPGELAHRRPRMLPDRAHVLYTATGFGRSDVVVRELETGTEKVRFEGTGARLAHGHLLFGRSRELWAIAFDADRVRTSGEAVRVVEGVQRDGYGAPQFALGEDGTLVWVPSGFSAEGTLVLTDRSGAVQTVLQELPTLSYLPRFSPSAGTLLIGIQDQLTEQFRLWRFDPARGSSEPVAEAIGFPMWSPDGNRFAYLDVDGRVWARNADGSGTPTILYESEYPVWPASWARIGDTEWLGLGLERPASGFDAVAVRLSDGEILPIRSTPATERFPMFAPGRPLVAYELERGGQFHVAVRVFPDGEERVVSVDGGIGPVWGPGGDQLYYSRGDQLWVVDVDMREGLDTSPPRLVFEGPYRSFNHAVSPDGETFALIRYDRAELPRIYVATDWLEELGSLVPAD
jgi:eukaryotic-like serine/threonine-protein kinase